MKKSGLFSVVQLEYFVLLPILVPSMVITGTSPSFCPHSEWDTMLGTGQRGNIVSTVAEALVWLGAWYSC